MKKEPISTTQLLALRIFSSACMLSGIYIFFHNERFSTFVIVLLGVMAEAFNKTGIYIRSVRIVSIVSLGFLICGTYIGTDLGFYENFVWWDTFLHFLSGILLGILAYNIIYYIQNHKADYFTADMVYSISLLFGISMATLWEIVEFGMDTLLDLETQMQANNTDTMVDLLMGTTGTLIALLIVRVLNVKSGKSAK